MPSSATRPSGPAAVASATERPPACTVPSVKTASAGDTPTFFATTSRSFMQAA